MTEYVRIEQDDWDYVQLEDGDLLILEHENANASAVRSTLSGNTICDRSGKKAYPHELTKDPYTGNMVLKRHADEPQQYTRKYRSDESGQSSADEVDDNFITVPITQDDL